MHAMYRQAAHNPTDPVAYTRQFDAGEGLGDLGIGSSKDTGGAASPRGGITLPRWQQRLLSQSMSSEMNVAITTVLRIQAITLWKVTMRRREAEVTIVSVVPNVTEQPAARLTLSEKNPFAGTENSSPPSSTSLRA